MKMQSWKGSSGKARAVSHSRSLLRGHLILLLQIFGVCTEEKPKIPVCT